MFNFKLITASEKSETQKQEKIEITADELSFDDKEKKTIAKGNAIVTHRTEKGIYILKAYRIEAMQNMDQKQNDDDKKNLFSEIKAIENVSLESDGHKVTANHCTYFKTRQEIICDGNVHIVDIKKGTTIKGNKCKIDLKLEKYYVFSEKKGKAEIVLFP
ncbi:MAG: hypothetical protein KBD31_03660 [Proteobacteria bacterium]|nr:hypothetical protein [Pseudomonadota bacterium]